MDLVKPYMNKEEILYLIEMNFMRRFWKVKYEK